MSDSIRSNVPLGLGVFCCLHACGGGRGGRPDDDVRGADLLVDGGKANPTARRNGRSDGETGGGGLGGKLCFKGEGL